MDNSEAVNVCRATAFATTFALQVHARIESGLGLPDSDEIWAAYTEEANAVADEAAKHYAKLLVGSGRVEE